MLQVQIAPNVFIMPTKERSVTIERSALADMTHYYQRRVLARPTAHRGMIALQAACIGLNKDADFFRVCYRGMPAEGTYRQQAMAFARVISMIDAKPKDYTSWMKIGAAFSCGHTLAIHAYHVYGASMREELEAIRG